MFGELQLGVVGILITFFWIIGLTNAYNFMDGIDGMAGGVALSAGIGWMWLSSNMTRFVRVLDRAGHQLPAAWVFSGTTGHLPKFLWVMSAVHSSVIVLRSCR